MADWKQIPDTDVDPDAPVTSELMYALRDNPVAIAEGADGAPRVSQLALEKLTAGDVLQVSSSAVRSVQGTDEVTVFGFGSLSGGTVRLGFEFKKTGAGSSRGRVRVRANGQSVFYREFDNITYEAVTIDVPLGVSGSLVVNAYTNTNTSPPTTEIRNLTISTGGEQAYALSHEGFLNEGLGI